MTDKAPFLVGCVPIIEAFDTKQQSLGFLVFAGMGQWVFACFSQESNISRDSRKPLGNDRI